MGLAPLVVDPASRRARSADVDHLLSSPSSPSGLVARAKESCLETLRLSGRAGRERQSLQSRAAERLRRKNSKLEEVVAEQRELTEQVEEEVDRFHRALQREKERERKEERITQR